MKIHVTAGGQKFSYSNQAPTHDSSYNYVASSGVIVDPTGASVGRFLFTPMLPKSVDLSTVSPSRRLNIINSDIIKEITKKDNDGAYFVLPSQLNGAEYPGPDQIVTHINEYTRDDTGGPRGQLAVHPAAGQFILDNAANDRNPDGINAIDTILNEWKKKI